MNESQSEAGHEPPVAATPDTWGAPADAQPTPSAETPSAETPPADTPPADTPPAETPSAETPSAEPAGEPGVEIVEGLPVVAEVRAIERPSPALLPAVQVAAVAATGFVAGAATVALARRRSARKLGRNGRGAPRRAVDVLPIAASRSFLVDVHVIAKPE